MDVHDVGDSLTKKAGPFPLWVWGVGIGAIAVAVMWMHSRGSDAGTVVTDPDTDSVMDGMDGALDTMYEGDNSGDVGGSGGGSGGSADDVSEEAVDVNSVGASGSGGGGGGKSNKRWRSRAFRALLLAGKNPVAVDRALGLYLAGKPLNQKQKRLVKLALQAAGMPPQGAPGITVKKPPRNQHGGTGGGKDDHGHTHPHVSNGGPSGPRRDRVVVTEAGDTYAKIAKRTYGSAAGVHVDKVRRANGGGVNQTFQAGQQVKVPHHNDGRRPVQHGGRR